MLKCIKIKAKHHAPVNSPVGITQNKLTNYEVVNMHINVDTVGNSVCTHG